MVKDGLVDADELAGKMERLILNVEDQYVDYLSNLKENININRSTEIPPKREMAEKYQYKKDSKYKTGGHLKFYRSDGAKLPHNKPH